MLETAVVGVVVETVDEVSVVVSAVVDSVRKRVLVNPNEDSDDRLFPAVCAPRYSCYLSSLITQSTVRYLLIRHSK